MTFYNSHYTLCLARSNITDILSNHNTKFHENSDNFTDVATNITNVVDNVVISDNFTDIANNVSILLTILDA